MNTIDDIDPRLDAHLRRTLREVAHTVPRDPTFATPPPTTPLRARRTRGRHLLLGVAAAVAALLIGIAVAIDPLDDPDVATVPDSRPTAQPLVLETWPGTLAPDGTPVPFPLGPVDPNGLHGSPQVLPDGRHVVLGVDDVSPEGRPEGFNEFTDITDFLVVMGADGEVQMEREVARTGGESIRLLAATADEAILARTPRNERAERTGPTSIVAHDLDSGDERPLATRLEDGGVVPAVHTAHALSPTLILALGPDDDEPGSPSATAPCSLAVVDLTTGDQTTHGLPSDCTVINGARLSPDGALVGVSYTSGATAELRLAVVDLASSTVRREEPIGCDEPTSCPGDGSIEYVGMAWDDDTSVRVAFVDLTANPDWNPEGHTVTRDDVITATLTVD